MVCPCCDEDSRPINPPRPASLATHTTLKHQGTCIKVPEQRQDMICSFQRVMDRLLVVLVSQCCQCHCQTFPRCQSSLSADVHGRTHVLRSAPTIIEERRCIHTYMLMPFAGSRITYARQIEVGLAVSCLELPRAQSLSPAHWVERKAPRDYVATGCACWRRAVSPVAGQLPSAIAARPGQDREGHPSGSECSHCDTRRVRR
jgi:hypothetical protein